MDLRLSDGEKDQLQREADSRGLTLTELVKERVFGPQADTDRLDDLERRLSRLEELAGL